MRTVTNQELNNDFESLRLHIIHSKIADKITQKFHFDEFFINQINAWNQLSTKEQNIYMKLIGEKIDLETSTFNEFFTQVAKTVQTPKFTTFNVCMMNELVKKYQPSMIIDPCMGWGHRLLMSMAYRIPYFGVDIRPEITKKNIELAQEASKKFQHYNPKVSLLTGDGATTFKTAQIDSPEKTMLFTCPPYHNSEIYSSVGIEQSEYPEFLKWWKLMSINAYKKNIQYFAYQITDIYGEDLKKITEKSGYSFIEHIENTRPIEKEKLHINTKGILDIKHYGKIYIFKKN